MSETLELPDRLSIFPLPGIVLLPGSFLPLHVFEPRYRNMVEDALTGGPFIGMIQPRDGDETKTGPPIHAVGCVGHLQQSRRLEDGRFLIVLQGLCRFRVVEELEVRRGYRRVVPSYDDFLIDVQEPLERLDTSDLLRHLRAMEELPFSVDDLAQLRAVDQIHVAAYAMPFPPEEKQALLEAPTCAERLDVLVSLLSMSAASAAGQGEEWLH